MKRIYIAEKPELARAIVDALGEKFTKKDGYYSNGKDTVTYCFGHLLKLFDPEDYDKKYKTWSFDHLPIIMIPWKLKPIVGKEKQLKLIIELMKNADEIIHAGDPDAEGQLIVDEIIKYANVRKPVKRLLINDNNIDVVRKSLQSMKSNEEFKGEYNSALARSVADQIYGYNLTRAYTLSAQSKGIHTILSVGRVQTPILGLVVNRDRARKNHKKVGYFNIVGKFKFDQGSIRANYILRENDPIDEKNRIIDKNFAEKIKQSCHSKKSVVTKSEISEKTTPAPLPFNLLQLQTEAHRMHGIRPDETLKITQDLREKRKLITYNRSDCQFLSDEQHNEAPAILATIEKNCTKLKNLVKNADANIKSRAFDSKNVTAHHAIIPTKMTCDLDTLGKDELKIYLMIVRVYLAQFYSKKVYSLKEVEISCNNHSFFISQTTTKKRGWTELYQEQDAKTKTFGSDLQQFSKGNAGECEDVVIEPKETAPPKLYSLGTLMKDLARVSQYVKDPYIKRILLEKDKEKKGEDGGIGTPATRAAMINILLKRKFIEEKNKKVISTTLGQSFHDSLPKSAVSPDMTALWHEKQKDIISGKLSIDDFLGELTKYLTIEIDIARKVLAMKSQNPKCPSCTGYLIKRTGKNGLFWACSKYPECKKTYPDKAGKPDTSARKYKCSECGEPLIRRPKKSGHWWACAGFPKCRMTYFDIKGEPSIVD